MDFPDGVTRGFANYVTTLDISSAAEGINLLGRHLVETVPRIVSGVEKVVGSQSKNTNNTRPSKIRPRPHNYTTVLGNPE